MWLTLQMLVSIDVKRGVSGFTGRVQQPFDNNRQLKGLITIVLPKPMMGHPPIWFRASRKPNTIMYLRSLLRVNLLVHDRFEEAEKIAKYRTSRSGIGGMS